MVVLSASKAIFRARTYSHTIYSHETSRKPTIRTRYPTLFDKWHGVFYMPSRTDTDGHRPISRPLFTQSWTTGGKPKCPGKYP